MQDRPAARLRPLTLVVLVVFVGLVVGAFLVMRQVVADQEHRLLQQRTEEAGLYVSSVVSSVQTELASLAASAAANHENSTSFQASTRVLTSLPGGFSTVALIAPGNPPHVIAGTGQDLSQALGPQRTAAVAMAADKVGLTGALVATPVLHSGDTRSLGFAYSSPSLSGAVVYAESVLRPTQVTDSQPFSELTAAVYATTSGSADQVVATNVPTDELPDLPRQSGTVSVNVTIGQGPPWRLVATAHHPLVGSVATAVPWAVLGGGIVLAVLAAGIVEILGRRRAYAMDLVAVRTAELEHSLADLAAAQDQLVRQERLAAIGELASTIGHELRNPLGVITNAVYLLRSDFGKNPSAAAERHLATAEREVAAATVIVSDLLEFARQRDPVLADVDVAGLIDEVRSLLPPPAGSTIDTSAVDRTAVVRADRDMMRQVLVNLVANAYQAMPDGGTVTVTASAADGSVRIGVRDTGSGIPADVRARVFEPFFTTKPHGIGLGLAVCRRMVVRHGGEIVVDSDPGHGTEFAIVLPALPTTRAAAESAVSTGESR